MKSSDQAFWLVAAFALAHTFIAPFLFVWIVLKWLFDWQDRSERRREEFEQRRPALETEAARVAAKSNERWATNPPEWYVMEMARADRAMRLGRRAEAAKIRRKAEKKRTQTLAFVENGVAKGWLTVD